MAKNTTSKGENPKLAAAVSTNVTIPKTAANAKTVTQDSAFKPDGYTYKR